MRRADDASTEERDSANDSIVRCLRGWQITDKILGIGGFARVHEAWGAEGSGAWAGRRAAVKVIDLRQQSAWAKSKLQSEVDNLRRAQGSAHVVTFFDDVRQGPYQLFVLEAWGQCDLLEYVLQSRGLGERRAQGVVAQLLKALAWLHGMSICHGDVKPENLLCERRGGVDHIKLTDFGSAVLLPPEGHAEVDPVAQGTGLYSPPEILLGRTYSFAVDMWATGITTYVIISGNFPFSSTSEVLSLGASFEGPKWSCPQAVKFISSLLPQDPSKRQTVRQAQGHTWMRLCQREPPDAISLPTEPLPSRVASSTSESSEPSTPPTVSVTPTVTVSCLPTETLLTVATPSASASSAASHATQLLSLQTPSPHKLAHKRSSRSALVAPAKKRFRGKSWDPAPPAALHLVCNQ